MPPNYEARFQSLCEDAENLLRAYEKGWAFDQADDIGAKRVSRRCCHLAIQHCSALLGLHNQRLHPSAAAMYRVCLEALFRGIWIGVVCSDEAIEERLHRDNFPGIGGIKSDLEKRRDELWTDTGFKVQFAFDLVNHAWEEAEMWHSFTHTGTMAIASPFSEEQLEPLCHVAAGILLAVSATAAVLFAGSPNVFPTAKALADQISKEEDHRCSWIGGRSTHSAHQCALLAGCMLLERRRPVNAARLNAGAVSSLSEGRLTSTQGERSQQLVLSGMASGRRSILDSKSR